MRWIVAALVVIACGRSPPPLPEPIPPAPAPTPAPTAEPPALADAPAEIGERVRHVVQVDGHPITVWERSPREPVGAIVLVHGRTWSAVPDFDLDVPGESRSLMHALARQGFATYAVDLRGYGDTPRDDSQWLTPDRAEADLASVLAWVRARSPDARAPAVLGWSLGSLVAQLCAQRHPDDIAALVLYGYPRDPDRRYDKTPTPASPPKKATTAKAAAEDFIVPGAISDAGRDAFVAAALAADPIKMDWDKGEQWNALDPKAVHVPTLVIHGERDPYAPVANQSKLFTRLGTPDRAWVIIADGDHAAHLENCGPRFVNAVVAFLRRDD